MCVAIPGQVVWIGAGEPATRPALVRVGAAERRVDLVMVPEVQVGDWVITHSGYAIRRMTEAAIDAWLADVAARAQPVATSRLTSAPTASAH